MNLLGVHKKFSQEMECIMYVHNWRQVETVETNNRIFLIFRNITRLTFIFHGHTHNLNTSYYMVTTYLDDK